MEILVKLMEEIYEISQIPFKLRKLVRDIYTSPNFFEEIGILETEVKVCNEEFKLIIPKEYEKAFKLLENNIINSIKNLNAKKNSIILDIINNENVDEDEILKVYPFLLKKFSMLYIDVDKNFYEVLSLVQNGYDNEEMIVIDYRGKIVVLGDLDDIYFHAVSLKENIASDTSAKAIISYFYIDNYINLSKVINNAINKINLAKKFSLYLDIIGENDLVFEEMIDNINDSKKKEIINRFYDGFRKLDNEMIKTIEVFFECGLNLSEGAKELYIHRNTLIYRLDKVQKYTGFDIRNFNMAALFKVIFVLFKEEKSKKY